MANSCVGDLPRVAVLQRLRQLSEYLATVVFCTVVADSRASNLPAFFCPAVSWQDTSQSLVTVVVL